MLSMVSQRGVSAQTTDPVAVVDAYRVATGHDVEAALALVADDATFTTVPPPPGTPGKWTGKEQIRQLLEFTVVMNAVHERVGSATLDGDKVTMTVMILNNNFRKWGIGAVEHTYEAVVQGGKIKSLITTMSPSERPRVAAAAQAYEAAQKSAPLAVVDTYLANLGNVEAQMALIADDAVMRIIPAPPNTPDGVWSGKDQVRQYFEFAKMQNPKVERLGSPTVEGDTVTMTVRVLVNDFREWGIGAVEHTYVAVVQGGKIKSFTFIMAPSERDRVAAAAGAYFAAHPPAGMPRTGGEQPVPLSLLVAFGMVAALIGLDLRRRAKPHIN